MPFKTLKARNAYAKKYHKTPKRQKWLKKYLKKNKSKIKLKRQLRKDIRNKNRRLRYKTDTVYRENCKAVSRANGKKPRIMKKIAIRNRMKIRKQREMLINLLGGKCVKCGIIDIRILQIDHIKGKGHRERKKFNSGTKLYKFYLSHPNIAKKKLQVLCANHNIIKRHENNEWSIKYQRSLEKSI